MKSFASNICLAVFASTALLFGSAVHAEQGWIHPVKVTAIVVTAGGAVNVRVSPGLSGCQSASGYGPTYATLYPDHPGKSAMHAVLMTAYMSEKSVGLYLSDSTCKIQEVILGTLW